jgi:hypothetical protein
MQNRGKTKGMKLVKESLSFERGKDPMDALAIGDPKIRQIHKNYEEIKSIIDTGTADELIFSEFRKKINTLKDIMDYVVVNHIRNNFDIDVKFQTEEKSWNSTASNLFAVADVGRYRYEFRKNGVGYTYWTEIGGFNQLSRDTIEGRAYIKLTGQSTTLKNFSSKLTQLLKKYH